MLTIWKHFLANRRAGMLPALITLAVMTLAAFAAVAAGELWLIAIGGGMWCFTWVFAVPAVFYLVDHPVKKPPPTPHDLLN